MTVATPLCHGTTLALLTQLALLFWMFTTRLTVASALCHGTGLKVALAGARQGDRGQCSLSRDRLEVGFGWCSTG